MKSSTNLVGFDVKVTVHDFCKDSHTGMVVNGQSLTCLEDNETKREKAVFLNLVIFNGCSRDGRLSIKANP
jgi:hypothetical protein